MVADRAMPAMHCGVGFGAGASDPVFPGGGMRSSAWQEARRFGVPTAVGGGEDLCLVRWISSAGGEVGKTSLNLLSLSPAGLLPHPPVLHCRISSSTLTDSTYSVTNDAMILSNALECVRQSLRAGASKRRDKQLWF